MVVTYRLHHYARNTIRVSITRGSSVLKVTLSFPCALTRDADTRPAVGDTIVELVNSGSLVLASHSLSVALAVDKNVLFVALPEFLACVLDGLHATISAHLGGRDVGM